MEHTKSTSFTIQVLSKQINTKEDLDNLVKDLISIKPTVQSVTFTGNSYSLDACTRISQILEECPNLQVIFIKIIPIVCKYV